MTLGLASLVLSAAIDKDIVNDAAKRDDVPGDPNDPNGYAPRCKLEWVLHLDNVLTVSIQAIRSTRCKEEIPAGISSPRMKTQLP